MAIKHSVPVIEPVWPLPQTVRCVITTRDEFGWGEAIAGSEGSDKKNSDRQKGVYGASELLQRQLNLDLSPQWLCQEHGTKVVEASADGTRALADASFSRHPGLACAVLTADCLPVLISSLDGLTVAAIHAGWRGLSSGIIRASISALDIAPQNLAAYLGPAISQNYFEVGPEVYRAFVGGSAARSVSDQVAACFRPSALTAGHFFADLYALGRLQLRNLGVQHIFGGHHCTYRQNELFYSYRRGADRGRMASLIWIEN